MFLRCMSPVVAHRVKGLGLPAKLLARADEVIE
jgi:hypothetical protein